MNNLIENSLKNSIIIKENVKNNSNELTYFKY
jgi:hypothetical protein